MVFCDYAEIVGHKYNTISFIRFPEGFFIPNLQIIPECIK